MSSQPAAQPVLPDDILEDIFLRLNGAADLACVHAACSNFRHVVSGGRFLRRFRSVHTPPVLGFLDIIGRNTAHSTSLFQPAQPPHRSAKGARALEQAADFTFSFVPESGASWRVRDARDGRVLLSRRTDMGFTAEDLVVGDPVHRRYVRIPAVPGDLAASTGHSATDDFVAFLDPAGDEEDESSVRVFCVAQSKSKVGAFIYSSSTGTWRYAASFSTATFEWLKLPKLMRRHYAQGCFYWADFYWNHMLVLDTHEMKLSVIDLPPEIKGEYKTIVEIGEARLGLVVLVDRVLHVYCKTLEDDGVGANDWWHAREIPLPNFHWSITAGAKGYILLRGIMRDYSQFWSFLENKPDAYYFTLDLKTFVIERLCMLNFDTLPDCLYTSFPPPLSPPSI